MDSYAENTLQQIAEERRTLFFGKYRGKVIEALTGDNLGQLKVIVPDVLLDQPGIAWPCVPFAGQHHGFISIPEKDDGVWIEFEGGNPAQPIWVGCWWGDGAMPSQADTKVRSWITTAGLAVIMDDDNKQLLLIHPDGPKITMTSNSIELSTDGATITLGAQGITVQGTTKVSA